MHGLSLASTPTHPQQPSRIHNIARCLLALLFISSHSLYAATVPLLFTGETHGAINPCDCPISPDGSLARRSTRIKEIKNKLSYKEKNLLLVDTGNFSAGSFYDTHTQGKTRDAQRTALVLKAMHAMGYTAITPGQHEIDLGLAFLTGIKDIPILSLNLAANDDPMLFTRSIKKTIAGRIFQLTAVNDVDVNQVKIKKSPILQSLSQYVNETKQAADHKQRTHILLCHGSEALAKTIAERFSVFDVILIGKSRTSALDFYHHQQTLLANFNTQGRALGHISLGDTTHGTFDYLTPDITDDSVIAQWVNNFKAQSKQQHVTRWQLDLTLHPFLQQSQKLISMLSKLNREIKGLDVNIYYQFSPDDHIPQFLFGQSALQEAVAQCYLREHHRDVLLDYLNWRINNPTLTAQQGFKQFNISSPPIKTILQEAHDNHYACFAHDAQRLHLLHITQSPALHINHNPYTGNHSRIELLAKLCRLKPFRQNNPSPCKSIPACFIDYDCHKSGVYAQCINPNTPQAHCKIQPAIKVEAKLIFAPDALDDPQQKIINQLAFFIPGLTIQRLTTSSPQAKTLLKRINTHKLPALIFDNNLRQAHRYPMIKQGLIKHGNQFLLNPDLSGANYHLDRPKTNTIQIFYNPTTPFFNHFISTYLDQHKRLNPDQQSRYSHHAIINRQQQRWQSAQGPYDLEEVKRQKTVALFFPKKSHAYLQARLGTAQTSYWQDAILSAKLDPKEIRQLTRHQRVHDALMNDAKLCKALAINQPGLLINNREWVTLSDPTQLLYLMEQIK